MGRLIIFGIDGLSFDQLPELFEKGVMPNLKKLLNSGGYLKRMQSSIPEVSSAAWASIVTSTNPGSHNIYGFTDLIDKTYAMAFTSSKTIKSKPFWNWDSSKKNLIMNVPQTYPAGEINGVLASGYVAFDLDKSIYPQDKLSLFKDSDYKIDVDMSLINESKDLFWKELSSVLQKRIEVFNKLYELEEWNNIMFVVTGTDRACHYMWDNWEDENALYHQNYLEFYKQVDSALGNVLDKLKDDDVFALVSDHGFERQDLSINLNTILKENGYIVLKNTPRISYNSIAAETKAFSMDPGRIYINREGKYPRGTVKEAEIETLLIELETFFKNYTINGRKIVSEIYRGDSIYNGPYAHRAPDLVLIGAERIALSSRIQSNETIEKTNITGKHKFNDAVFYCKTQREINLPETVKVENVMDIIKQTGIL